MSLRVGGDKEGRYVIEFIGGSVQNRVTTMHFRVLYLAAAMRSGADVIEYWDAVLSPSVDAGKLECGWKMRTFVDGDEIVLDEGVAPTMFGALVEAFNVLQTELDDQL